MHLIASFICFTFLIVTVKSSDPYAIPYESAEFLKKEIDRWNMLRAYEVRTGTQKYAYRLNWDEKLVEEAKQSCGKFLSPSGRVIHQAENPTKSFRQWIAHKEVQDKINMNQPELYYSYGQSKIGCVDQKCTFKFLNEDYTAATICVLGPNKERIRRENVTCEILDKDRLCLPGKKPTTTTSTTEPTTSILNGVVRRNLMAFALLIGALII